MCFKWLLVLWNSNTHEFIMLVFSWVLFLICILLCLCVLGLDSYVLEMNIFFESLKMWSNNVVSIVLVLITRYITLSSHIKWKNMNEKEQVFWQFSCNFIFFMSKSILHWTFRNVTKAKCFGLDTYYYIKPMQVGNSNKMDSNKWK
jgi:hypothetical protein